MKRSRLSDVLRICAKLVFGDVRSNNIFVSLKLFRSDTKTKQTRKRYQIKANWPKIAKKQQQTKIQPHWECDRDSKNDSLSSKNQCNSNCFFFLLFSFSVHSNNVKSIYVPCFRRYFHCWITIFCLKSCVQLTCVCIVHCVSSLYRCFFFRFRSTFPFWFYMNLCAAIPCNVRSNSKRYCLWI